MPTPCHYYCYYMHTTSTARHTEESAASLVRGHTRLSVCCVCIHPVCVCLFRSMIDVNVGYACLCPIKHHPAHTRGFPPGARVQWQMGVWELHAPMPLPPRRVCVSSTCQAAAGQAFAILGRACVRAVCCSNSPVWLALISCVCWCVGSARRCPCCSCPYVCGVQTAPCKSLPGYPLLS